MSFLRDVWEFYFRHPRDWTIPTAKRPKLRPWTQLEKDCVTLHIAQATTLHRLK